MFGILEKMDRFSNNLMTRNEIVSFIQEIVDNNMVWDMHDKYQNAAMTLIGQGKVNSRLPLGAFDKIVEDENGHVLNGPCFSPCCTPTTNEPWQCNTVL